MGNRAAINTNTIHQMMTRSEGGENQESFEEAPYEKSQNEGLNLILFQGANNMRDSGDEAEEVKVLQDPDQE